MPTIASAVLDWLGDHPNVPTEVKREVIKTVPAHQWAMPGGYWNELALHCNNRVEIKRSPRFMNRLAINVMEPLPRCLFRSPDGRGLAWLKSGGELECYGRCEQQYCEHAKANPIPDRA